MNFYFWDRRLADASQGWKSENSLKVCIYSVLGSPLLTLIFLYLNLSIVRSLALRLRLFSSSSFWVAEIPLLISLPSGVLPQTQTGNSLGQVQPFVNSRNFSLTVLSSSEWKVIIESLPPTLRLWNISSIDFSRVESSSFTSILIAWKALRAGCPSRRTFWGTEFFIISASSRVVSIGFSPLALTMFLAMLFAFPTFHLN